MYVFKRCLKAHHLFILGLALYSFAAHPASSTLTVQGILRDSSGRVYDYSATGVKVRADQSYNLLRADVFQKLSANPSFIRESLIDKKNPLIVIDEIQKLPNLMNEVRLNPERKNSIWMASSGGALC